MSTEDTHDDMRRECHRLLDDAEIRDGSLAEQRALAAEADAATMRRERDEAKAEVLALWERLGEANHRTLEAMAERDAAHEAVRGLFHEAVRRAGQAPSLAEGSAFRAWAYRSADALIFLGLADGSNVALAESEIAKIGGDQ